MKEKILVSLGSAGALIASAFGGWTGAMTTLCTFMMIDYLTGMIVALVFKKSPKTESGAASSKVGWTGLFKKGMILVILYMSCRLDMLLGSTYIKDGTCICFILNESISIIENAGLMGVPIPAPVLNAVDILHAKSRKKENPKKDDDSQE